MTLNSSKQIRILVVDDSAFMRKALTIMLESDPEVKVVGTACDGQEGVEKARLLKPDLVTMDIEMPRMDGLTALREIMESNPLPVMMVSSITTEGAQTTLDALEIGAVDFIPKQMSYVSLDIIKIQEELLAKIKNIVSRKAVLMARFRHSKARAGLNAGKRRTSTTSYSEARAVKKRAHHVGIIAIGSSTGGPPALHNVISRLPRNMPVGLVVAQHMPAAFTKSLADRLDSGSQVTVREAEGGEKIEAGLVFIAPGGKNMTVNRRGGAAYVNVSDRPLETLYKPCVDVLLNSVCEGYGNSTMGVILTGMGNNGLKGSQSIKDKGGIVIAQDEASSVVYGMPRAIVDAKLADHIVSIDEISNEIVSYF